MLLKGKIMQSEKHIHIHFKVIYPQVQVVKLLDYKKSCEIIPYKNHNFHRGIFFLCKHTVRSKIEMVELEVRERERESSQLTHIGGSHKVIIHTRALITLMRSHVN